jgi:quercetin dioxygenase-like cupin family protein
MIDFEKIPETAITNFHGGDGICLARMFQDKDVKIMRSVLHPGVSNGLHRHQGSYEVCFVLQGEATCVVDGKKEIVKAGQVSYCPNGSEHSMANEGTEDCVVLCVVGTTSR